MYKLIAVVVLISVIGCFKAGPGIDARKTDAAGPASLSAASVAAHAPSAAVVAPGRRASADDVAALADLPDRGELLTYSVSKSELRDVIRKGAYTWRRVEVSEEHALRAVAAGRLRVPTASGEMLEIIYDRHEELPSGDWTWIGHIPGEPGVQTILTFGANAVFGSIGQPGKRSLRVTTRDGSAWMVETDPDALIGIASAGANPRASDHLAVPKARRDAPSTASDTGPVAVPAIATAAATTIDVVIGYTQGFVTENGGSSAAATRLNYLVAVANQALSNSQVDASIRLVHSLQVNYTDTSSNSDTLEQLTGYDVDQQRYTTPNSAFDALRAAREQHGADLVTLVRGFRDPEQDGCGIAWLIGGGRSGVSSGDGQDYFGYSVVSDGDDANEVDGETYFCRDESFIHEIGHNLGSQHDRGTAEDGDGSLDPDDYGIFTYSFGLKTSASAGNFFTIMAYGDQGQTDFRVFSNPRTTFCGGRACGTTEFEDNARSLGQTAPVVATFRGAVSPPPTGGIGQGVLLKQVDFNGNRRSDIFFYNHAVGRIVLWFMNALSRDAASSVLYSGAHRVVDSGDFDGDGRTDLLLTSANRDVIIARSTGSSLSFINTGLGYAAEQTLVGLADVNGDGRSDILVRNTGGQTLAIWFMNGATRYAFNSRALSGALQYVGSGDLDGNRRHDLLWKDAQNNVYASVSNGSGFVTTYIGLTHAASYGLYGLLDVNGDGKSDIILHDVTQRRLVVWYMNGTTRYAFNSHTTAAGFRLVGKGDFDGNRRGDLLLGNPQTGQTRYMLSSGSAFALALLPYTPQSGYQIMDLD